MKATKRIRRWQRSAPTRELALTVVGIGCVLILIAALIAGFATHWL